MKSKTIFTLIGIIHMLIGLAIIAMVSNFDVVINSWVSSAISDDVKGLLIGQLRVIIVHSVGVGIIMWCCRNIENSVDIKRVFLGYVAFSFLALLNGFYAEFFGQGGPPLPVFVLLISASVLGCYGFFTNKV